MRSKIFGLVGEYFTMFLYMIRFYKILAHRMRNMAGEIDIIVKSNREIIFVEVKSRKYKFADYDCSKNQITRIKNAALIYISQNPQFKDCQMRFDLVIIRPYQLPQIIRNI